MKDNCTFDLEDFMPYLLNQAADASSRGFETYYKSKYNMLRTEWRVVFHPGRYGRMTAKEICERARIHKTKVSRAVHALEEKKLLKRTQSSSDRRHENLEITRSGIRVFQDLSQEAGRYDAEMMGRFTPKEQQQLRNCLIKIAKL